MLPAYIQPASGMTFEIIKKRLTEDRNKRSFGPGHYSLGKAIKLNCISIVFICSPP